ncbi:MAG: hypothetical protein QW332_06820 [Thermoproteota archaeon]
MKKYSVETRWVTEILHDALKKRCIKSLEEYVQILDACINQGLCVGRKQGEKAIEIAERIIYE